MQVMFTARFACCFRAESLPFCSAISRSIILVSDCHFTVRMVGFPKNGLLFHICRPYCLNIILKLTVVTVSKLAWRRALNHASCQPNRFLNTWPCYLLVRCYCSASWWRVRPCGCRPYSPAGCCPRPAAECLTAATATPARGRVVPARHSLHLYTLKIR